MHANLAAGITPQHRTILTKKDLHALPGRCDGRTDAGHAAAGHENIAGQLVSLKAFHRREGSCFMMRKNRRAGSKTG